LSIDELWISIRLRRINRHSTFVLLKFPFRSDWTLAAKGGAYMKLHEVKSEPQNRRISNVESSSGGQVSKDGIASLSHFFIK
jgi:hypothetical protein